MNTYGHLIWEREIDQSILQEFKTKYNILYRRLCHVVDENQRVKDMKDQLQQGTVDKVGTILRDSHESLKCLYEVSCEEIDYIIQLSEVYDGWYGGRIIGGGFGGCSIHLVADHVLEDYHVNITTNYIKKYNIIPDIKNLRFPGGVQYL